MERAMWAAIGVVVGVAIGVILGIAINQPNSVVANPAAAEQTKELQRKNQALDAEIKALRRELPTAQQRQEQSDLAAESSRQAAKITAMQRANDDLAAKLARTQQ